MNNSILLPQDYDRIADAILCKIEQNVIAIGMITDSCAIHSLEEENRQLNYILKRICEHTEVQS